MIVKPVNPGIINREPMRKIMMLSSGVADPCGATPAAQAKEHNGVALDRKGCPYYKEIRDSSFVPRAIGRRLATDTWCSRVNHTRRGIQLNERQAPSALLRKQHSINFVSSYNTWVREKLIPARHTRLQYSVLGAVNKSTVYKELKRGDRNIYKEYTAALPLQGKCSIASSTREGKVEYFALFVPDNKTLELCIGTDSGRFGIYFELPLITNILQIKH